MENTTNPKAKDGVRTENKEIVVSTDERNMAMIAHLGGIIFGFIPALLIWMMKKDEPGFVSEQAKEALNFQILVAICIFVSVILILAFIGILLLVLVGIANVIYCILAAMKASEGEPYRYPFSLRLIK
jgi:uncharacterized Tic20 family protein